MTFSISQRVAQVCDEAGFRGTAWLISDTLALTAGHCVAVDTTILNDLTLCFPAGDLIRVTVRKHDPARDVALLEVVPEDRPMVPSGHVIALARRSEPVTNNEVQISGYPADIVNSRATAFVMYGRVVDPKVALTRNNRPIFAQVSPSTVNGAGHDALQGLSGSPVCDQSDADGDEMYAFGLALEVPTMGNIDIVPVAALLDWEEVSAAYAASPHTPRGPLCLHVGDTGMVVWSACVRPANISRYWDADSPVTSISCRASRQELGEGLFFALVRLATHSARVCSVRGRTDWTDTLISVPEEKRPVILECEGDHRRHRPMEMFACPESISADELTETIHLSLDHFLLDNIDRRLKQVLGGMPPPDAPDINPLLAEEMLDIWQKDWHPALNRDPRLLRVVLVRLACHEEGVSPAKEAMVLVGGPRPCPDSFWKPFLFALALSAAGVTLNFAILERGNMLTDGGVAGHACGCERIRNEKVAKRLGRKQWWSVALVLLPLMAEPYLGRFKRMIDMRHASAVPRIGEGPPPQPVIVTGDSSFEDALQDGAEAVKKHVKALKDELATEIERLYDARRASEWKTLLTF